MRKIFITHLDYENKGGLYLSTINQICNLYNKNSQDIVVNIALTNNYNKKTNVTFINKIPIININIFSKKLITKFFLKIKYDSSIFLLDSKIKKIFEEDIKIKETDIIIAHWGHLSVSLGNLLRRRYMCKNINVFHGSDIHTYPKKYYLYKKNTKRNMEGSKANIFVSDNLREDAIKNINYKYKNQSKKNHVVYNPIEIEKKVIEYSKKTLKETTSLAYIGSFEKVKGVNNLPNIIGGLDVNTLKNIENIYLIGKGSLKEEVKNKIKEILKNKYNNINLIIFDHLSQKDIHKIMSEKIDLIIVPSENEGLGNIIIEAQQLYIDVIISGNGGTKEAITLINENKKSDYIIKEYIEKQKVSSEKAWSDLLTKKILEKDFEDIVFNQKESVNRFSNKKFVNAFEEIIMTLEGE